MNKQFLFTMLTTLLHYLYYLSLSAIHKHESFWLCFYVIHFLLLSPFSQQCSKISWHCVVVQSPRSVQLFMTLYDCSTPGLCSSPSPEVFPSSCPLHWWCHPAISSPDVLFSFFFQSFPESQTFPMSQMFTSNYQNIGVSTSASVLPKSIQGQFPPWFDLAVQGSLRSLSPAPQVEGLNSSALCLL